MLSQEQRLVLQLVILSYLLEQGGTPAQLAGREVAARLPLNANAMIAATYVTDCCGADPELLRQVLRGLDPTSVNAELEAIRAAAASWQPTPAAEPFSTLELSDGPFLDRDRLRGLLRDLADRSSAPILLVSGEEGIGKSYSGKMIAEEADRHAELRVARIKAEPSSPDIWGVMDVATEIVRRLSTPPGLPPTHAVLGDRLAGLLADWTADAITRSGDQLWIIFDGFGHPDIRQETRSYVDEMIAMTGVDPRLEQTRVVLLDFEFQRLAALSDQYEALALHLPGEEEIQDYFNACYPNLPQISLQSAAAIALEEVPESGPARMIRIQHNVRRAKYVLEQSG